MHPALEGGDEHRARPRWVSQRRGTGQRDPAPEADGWLPPADRSSAVAWGARTSRPTLAASDVRSAAAEYAGPGTASLAAKVERRASSRRRRAARRAAPTRSPCSGGSAAVRAPGHLRRGAGRGRVTNAFAGSPAPLRGSEREDPIGTARRHRRDPVLSRRPPFGGPTSPKPHPDGGPSGRRAASRSCGVDRLALTRCRRRRGGCRRSCRVLTRVGRGAEPPSPRSGPDRCSPGPTRAMASAPVSSGGQSRWRHARHEPLIGLLGNPAYYGRFGFVSSTDHGIDAPAHAVRRAPPRSSLWPAHDPSVTGTFRSASAFG